MTGNHRGLLRTRSECEGPGAVDFDLDFDQTDASPAESYVALPHPLGLDPGRSAPDQAQ